MSSTTHPPAGAGTDGWHSEQQPEPTQLLTSTKTLSEERNNWFQPIYLGAVVSLEIGDKLMVNVSDIKLVDYTKEHKTFFGAFLL